MLPLLPFLAGIVVGSLSVSAVRRSRVRATLHHAGDTLREAAHAGQAFTQRFTERVWPSTPAPAPTPAATDPVPAPAAPVATFAEGASASAPTPAKPRKRTSKKASAPATATPPTELTEPTAS